MVKELFKDDDNAFAKDKILVTFKVLIPAQEAKPVAPLGPVLGQYKVSLVDFCKDFNARSSEYDVGTILRVSVSKLPNEKNYNMQIMPPPLAYLIMYQLMPQDQDAGWIELSTVKRIEKKLLFDVIRVFALLHQLSLPIAARCVFSFLRTTGIRNIY